MPVAFEKLTACSESGSELDLIHLRRRLTSPATANPTMSNAELGSGTTDTVETVTVEVESINKFVEPGNCEPN